MCSICKISDMTKEKVKNIIVRVLKNYSELIDNC